MKKINSLGNKIIAAVLSIVIVLSMIPANVIAQETAVAKIGDTPYDTLEEAIAAVPTGTNQATPAEATTITLLGDTSYAFDVGVSTGATTMNLKLDLNEHKLTLAPSVGSVGTKTNGIRVLAYSKLEIANGTLICSSKTEDNVKVGIANYGDLVLDDVTVQAGDLTVYTINNRGALELKGKTKITGGSTCAITNDPYDLYYTTNKDASITCDSDEVEVDSILVERYARDSANKGGVKLNISAGYFGKVAEDGNSSVAADYNVTGGTIGVSTTEELEFALNMVNAGEEYSCPEKPVTIKLLDDIDGSFDVGTSTGKAPKNIVLDLNEKTLTLKPGIGSFNTKTNGIRVLAYSKLAVKNGKLVCSSEEADNVKVGIANYGDLSLEDVIMQAGDLTIYTINNRGALELKGKTEISKGTTCAITNDPYDLYYTTDRDASITCDSADVSVESILVERYERNSANKGGVKLNISAGYIGEIKEDGNESVGATYEFVGATFGELTSDFCPDGYMIVKGEDGKFSLALKPGYAEVESFSGGTITGNGTEIVEVLIEDVTLQWVAADNNVGRGQDGWYVGIKVNIPERAYNVKLQRRTAVNSETGDESWEDVTFTKDGENYTELWGLITEEYLKSFKDNGKKLNYIWQFSWDGDDTYEQRIAIVVDPEGNIILEDNNVQVYPPLGTVEILTGEGTITGNTTGEVEVIVKKADLNWSPIDTSIGRNEQSWWVGIKVVAPEGHSADATYKVMSDTVAGFGNAKSFAQYKDGENDIQLWLPIPSNFKEENKVITRVYIFDWNNDGDYEQQITFSVEPSDEIVLNKKTWEPFSFESPQPTITYAPGLTYTNTLDGIDNSVDSTVGFEIIEELYEGQTADVADIDTATGELTIKQSGTVKVRATRRSDDWYEERTAEYTLTVKKADQLIAFETVKEVDELVYTPNLLALPTITGKLSDKNAVYTVTTGNGTVAQIKESKLELLKAGYFELTVCVPTDKCYLESNTLTWKVTVQKENQTFADTDAFTEDVTLTYGTIDFTKTVETITPNSGNSTVYTLSDNEIDAQIDSTGKVTFASNKVGSVTVTASVEGDERYNAAESISYKITVVYLKIEDEDKPTVGDQWHTKAEVTVSAPNGYSISKTGELAEEEWSNSVIFDANDGITDGDNNSVKVYLRNADGYITDGITLSGIKVDTTKPTDLGITYKVKAEADIGENHYGFSDDTVTVTVTASDATSGLEKIEYSLNGGDTYTEITAVEGEYKFPVAPQYRGQLMIKATDVAGNDVVFTKRENATDILVVDRFAPGLNVGFTGGMSSEPTDGILYVNKDKVTVEFTVTDENFDLGIAKVTVNSNPVDSKWDFDDHNDIGTLTFELTEEGDYEIYAEFADRLGRTVTYEAEIRIDRTEPTIESTIVDGKYYTEDQTFVLTITEHNFDATKVELEIGAVNSKGEPALTEADIQAFADIAWVQDTENLDVYTLTLPITKDGNYTVTVNYADELGWEANTHSKTFTVDKVDPDQPTIKYEIASNGADLTNKTISRKPYGFAKETVLVTVQSADATSGLDYIELMVVPAGAAGATTLEMPENLQIYADGTTKGSLGFISNITVEGAADDLTFSFEIPAQFRGTVTAVAHDKAGLSEEKVGKREIVVDGESPVRDYEWSFTNDQVREYNNIFYTQGETKVKFTITEANFDLSLKAATDETVAPTPVLTVNDVAQDITWTQIEGTDKWETELTLSGNGDYVVKLSYTDRSSNAMETYTKEIHIDDKAPVFKVTYDNNNERNENNYKADRTATVKVTEHNFEPKEVKLTVTAKDITGKKVDISEKAYAAYAKTPTNWTRSGDVWTLNTAGMKFDIEAIYSVKLEYTDLAENGATAYVTEFVVDKTIPGDVTVEYSTSVVDKILETITFGFYQGDVQIKVTAKDQTAGVEYFKITYTQVDGANNSNKETYKTAKLTAVQNAKNKTVFTATYTIKAQARGKVSVDLIDKAGNATGKAEEYVIVADTIAPGLEYKYIFTNDQVREYNNIFYTQGETKVKFTITEANFDISKRPVLTVNRVAQDVAWTQIEGTDKWETELTLSGNGDYKVKLTYKDRSTNTMETYTKEIHIDNKAPVFKVTYDNNKDRNENNYKADRTATIKVTEHNFKPDEVKLTVTAKDITGKKVDISEKAYAAYAKTPTNWTRSGDVWTLNTAGMKFDIEAIYSVKLEYTDLAENGAVAYVAEFVVDKTIPGDVTIEYSTSVVDKILETITFGFYKSKVKVTLSANDITSGVDYFEWKYTKTGTSDKNAQSNGTKIAAEDIVYSNKGKTATATFTIPANARGYITAKATDRAGNYSKLTHKEDMTIVVDNIAPGRTVSYNPGWILDADTLLNAGKTFAEGDNVVLYYDEPAVVTFKIDEANFYAEDVVIKVNGEKKVPTDWTQNGDVWTGTITIEGDGDYEVTMTYKDRSSNRMEKYTSQKIVIDTTAPEIGVTYEASTQPQFVKKQVVVDSFDKASVAYYNGSVTAKIVINEANFFEGVKADNGFVIHNVGIKVTKTDDNGIPTVYEWLPAGAQQKYVDATPKYISWETDGDEHSFELEYKDNADYVLEIEYTDPSKNDANISANDGKTATKVYKSKIVTVDKAAPVVTVAYDNENVIYTDKNGREYFAADRTATITVEEHNFRAADFKTTVTAKDILGKDVEVEDFANYLSDPNNWETNGNTHVAKVTYSVDANYTFDFTYQDLAQNKAGNYKKELFTVDKTAPEVNDVKFELVSDQDMKNEQGGIKYFGGEVYVTISATDKTSGIYKFAYNGLLVEESVSKVNMPVEGEANPNHVKGTYEFTHTFQVPVEKLTPESQFNGYVKFTAYDRSQNNAIKDEKDNAHIVVDNLAPQSDISFTDPVATVGNKKYFNGNIDTTIVITEANFHSEDVIVKVNGETRAVEWVDNSVDVHTGTFTLTGDGEYVVTVTYTDRSGNKMPDFTPPDTWIIDTKDPVVEISGIMHESANTAAEDQFIGFTVTVTDRNLQLDDINLFLKAIVKKGAGKNPKDFAPVDIDWTKIEDGRNANDDTFYTFTVENMPADGFYTLGFGESGVTDLANHTVRIVNSTNINGETVTTEDVNWTINRNGSVFWITATVDDKDIDLDKLNGSYLNGEVEVKINESNVDKVDEWDKKTVFTLNNGSAATDVVLNETNYTKNTLVGDGGWYQTTYTLDNSYFEKDGVYSVNIITYDKAGNSSVNTKNKEGTVSFTIDRTKPVISANLISGQIVNDTQYKVYFQITELNLNAEEIEVKYNGKTVELENLGNNEYSFTAKEGLNQSVQITATDLAGNVSELYKADPFTVSTSFFIRWYATGIWFWLPVIGVPTLTGLAILLIVLKKKKQRG